MFNTDTNFIIACPCVLETGVSLFTTVNDGQVPQYYYMIAISESQLLRVNESKFTLMVGMRTALQGNRTPDCKTPNMWQRIRGQRETVTALPVAYHRMAMNTKYASATKEVTNSLTVNTIHESIEIL